MALYIRTINAPHGSAIFHITHSVTLCDHRQDVGQLLIKDPDYGHAKPEAIRCYQVNHKKRNLRGALTFGSELIPINLIIVLIGFLPWIWNQ